MSRGVKTYVRPCFLPTLYDRAIRTSVTSDQGTRPSATSCFAVLMTGHAIRLAPLLAR